MDGKKIDTKKTFFPSFTVLGFPFIGVPSFCLALALALAERWNPPYGTSRRRSWVPKFDPPRDGAKRAPLLRTTERVRRVTPSLKYP